MRIAFEALFLPGYTQYSYFEIVASEQRTTKSPVYIFQSYPKEIAFHWEDEP